MERYYDLVMAYKIREYVRDEIGMALPGLGPKGYSEDERWEMAKKTFSGSRIGVISEWGLIDFDPYEKEKLVGGESLTYDDYLEILKVSAGSVRRDFEKAYYDSAGWSFKGKIQKIRLKQGRICFERIFVEGQYTGGYGDRDFFSGKEDHVWMPLDGFEDYRVGECLKFEADIYRYIKTGNGKRIDYGLRNPTFIEKIEEYELPSDETLRMQAIDEIICDELCIYNEHCSGGICLASEEWRNAMRRLLLDQKM